MFFVQTAASNRKGSRPKNVERVPVLSSIAVAKDDRVPKAEGVFRLLVRNC